MSGDDRRVIVTSAQERFALAACRTLGTAGYSVVAVADVTPAAGHWSRCAAERHVLVDPRRDPAGFVDGLAAIARAGSGEAPLLFPGTDAALMAVSSRRARLDPFAFIGLPPHDVVDACTDKIRLQDASRKAGVAAPEAVVCSALSEAPAAAEELGYPVVLKAQRTFFELNGRVQQRGSTLADDRAAVERLAARFGLPFLVQKAIRGDAYSAAGVATEEGLLAFAVARYIRTWPPEGGNVAFAETVEPPTGLGDAVGGLMADLGWRGIFELELMRDEDGRFHAIDLNPRLYGSLALASAAGTPFAAIWCDHLVGAPPPRQTTARPGVRYRWEEADLRYAIFRAKEGRIREALAAVAPRRRVTHAYFQLTDPAPLLARAVVVLQRKEA
jgi:predicted ATP-grasp superfamily ATP-dependent carboligase